MATNTKKVSQKVQEHILDMYDDYQEMINQLPFLENSLDDPDYYITECDNARKFLAGITGEPLEVQKSKYSDAETWQIYRDLIKKEIPHIRTENDRSYINNVAKLSEDLWIKNKETKSSLEPDETLSHTFGNTTVKFRIYEADTETAINFNPEPTLTRCNVYLEKNIGSIDTAKRLVENTIKHFDQFGQREDLDMFGISDHLYSQISKLRQEAESRNPRHLDTQLAKRAGYVQGVCECVAAIDNDQTLGKKLLSETNITKDMAKKFANPETYKALEQGIFAPQQKIEHTHNLKR